MTDSGVWKYKNGATCLGIISQTILEQEKQGLLEILSVNGSPKVVAEQKTN